MKSKLGLNINLYLQLWGNYMNIFHLDKSWLWKTVHASILMDHFVNPSFEEVY